MGLYRVEIEAIGGHGCQREIEDGKQVYGCRHMGCPDCQVRELIETLKRGGNNVTKAVLTHWPDTLGQVRDNLLTRERTGSFNKS